MRNDAHTGKRPGFTLIELLVVIAVISILAAMIIPVGKAVNRQKIISKSRAELYGIQTLIEAYKAKLGHYPPDNPRGPITNQLYFELLGTTLSNGVYVTLDGSAQISTTAIKPLFGVDGFVNCTQPGGGDEARLASRFLPGLKPGQIGDLTTNSANRVRVLLCSVPWPFDVNFPIANHPGMNPIRYNSSSPTNNPNSYDLWIDVVIDGKTNRISNWSKERVIVSTPW